MDQARELVSVVGPQGVGGEDMVSVFLPPTPFFTEAATFLTDLVRLGARQRIHPTNEKGRNNGHDRIVGCFCRACGDSCLFQVKRTANQIRASPPRWEAATSQPRGENVCDLPRYGLESVHRRCGAALLGPRRNHGRFTLTGIRGDSREAKAPRTDQTLFGLGYKRCQNPKSPRIQSSLWPRSHTRDILLGQTPSSFLITEGAKTCRNT